MRRGRTQAHEKDVLRPFVIVGDLYRYRVRYRNRYRSKSQYR